MDGYAVRAAECESGQTCCRFLQRIPAGHILLIPFKKGSAARIFTGAFIPDGADAVVMQNKPRSRRGQWFASCSHIARAPKAGEWIRRQGEDIRAGANILKAGTRLRAQEYCGLAASVGLAQLPVVAPLRVAVFLPVMN